MFADYTFEITTSPGANSLTSTIPFQDATNSASVNTMTEYIQMSPAISVADRLPILLFYASKLQNTTVSNQANIAPVFTKHEHNDQCSPSSGYTVVNSLVFQMPICSSFIFGWNEFCLHHHWNSIILWQLEQWHRKIPAAISMTALLTEIQNYVLPYGSLGPTGYDPYRSQSTGNGSHHWCFLSLEILRCLPWTHVVSSWWVPFEL